MTLNRNPENYFAEVEQVTFSPGNFVPGIEASPDKLLQGRLFAYGDAHRHRVGANSHQLPINQAKAPVNNYQKTAICVLTMAIAKLIMNQIVILKHQKKILQRKLVPLKLKEMLVIIAIIKITLHKQTLCIICCQAKKRNLINNIAASLGQVKNQEIIARQIDLFTRVNPEYGARVAQAIKQQA